MIESLDELKTALVGVWSDISASCAVCKDPDCMGYLWVVPEEEDALLDAGVQVVQVNGEDGPIFIDVYPRDDDGNLVVNTQGPLCPYRGADGRCTMHDDRPITCHMYPFGLEPEDGGFVWALHTECEYVRSRSELDRQLLLVKLRELVDDMSPAVNDMIVSTFMKADAIAADWTPPNQYLAVAPALLRSP